MKAHLRRTVGAALRALPQAARSTEADDVVRRVGALLPVGLVLAYAPLPDEVDVGPLLGRLAREGRLVLPRVHGHDLALHRANDETGLVRGALGVQEPHGEGESVAPETLAAVIVPARAFDRAGARLGRGKGYYDRFLPRAPQALLIGVAHSVQLLPHVPAEPHDAPVDVVVVPGEVVVTGARGRTPTGRP